MKLSHISLLPALPLHYAHSAFLIHPEFAHSRLPSSGLLSYLTSMNKHFLNKRLVHQLGFAGLVPFVLLALACWVVSSDWVASFVNAQQVYAIVILSFLGGIHWGAIMTSTDLTAVQTKRALCWSVVPTVLACMGTVFGPFNLAVLIAVFWVAIKSTSAYTRGTKWPSGFYACGLS